MSSTLTTPSSSASRLFPSSRPSPPLHSFNNPSTLRRTLPPLPTSSLPPSSLSQHASTCSRRGARARQREGGMRVSDGGGEREVGRLAVRGMGGHGRRGSVGASSSREMAAVAADKASESRQQQGEEGSSSSSSSRDAEEAGRLEEETEGGCVEGGLYTPFVEYCVRQVKQRFKTWDYPIKDKWQLLRGGDGGMGQEGAVCRSSALEGEKIRLMRAADISAGPSLQVLNLIIFPRPEFDFPYFCADLVTFPKGHLIVIDLDPLYQSEEYFAKYIARMMPMCHEYCKVLPWGGEMTAESLQFFSPALIWSRLPLDADVTADVFDAFKDYLHVWMDMVEECEPETSPEKIAQNMEAQHRYICWRAEKDPGRPVLTRLFGSKKCEDYIEGFLFAGASSLGTKGFLDYFPQYRMPDGSVSKRRSMVGRSYPDRPWDANGRLHGD